MSEMEQAAFEGKFKELGLGGYDWPNVFKYATNERYEYGSGDPGDVPSPVPPGADVPIHFSILDVERIDKSVDGEGDSLDWVAIGVLKDGRWFSVSAGCDYTGWG
jgi:hypothetical protein